MNINIEGFFREVFKEARNKTTEEFISQAKQIHPEYDYSKVNYVNANTKVIITCPRHGDFLIFPNNFLKSGCPKCSKNRFTTDEFIERAKRVHPEYDYSKVNYVNAHVKVIIGCPVHGDFLITPNNLLDGHGCSRCANQHKTTKEFIAQARQIHPEYDYSKVNYVNAITKVTVICPKHGEFSVVPNPFLRGIGGCPRCGKGINAKKNADKFIEKVKQIHPEYDYSKVNYIDSKTKVIVTCPKHGDFMVAPNNLLKGRGCPRCNESKGERLISDWLNKNNIDYIDQYRFEDFKRYPYDFYLPKHNLVIEFNGKQHYEKIETKFHKKPGSFEGQLVRDHLKKAYAERNGIELLVIPYWDFDNIDKILSEKLLKN